MPGYGPIASYPTSGPDALVVSVSVLVPCAIGTSWAPGSWTDTSWACGSWAGTVVPGPDVVPDMVSGPIGLARRVFHPVVRPALIHGSVHVDLSDLVFSGQVTVTQASVSGQMPLVLTPLDMALHGTMTPAGTRGRVALSGAALEVYVAIRPKARRKGH